MDVRDAWQSTKSDVARGFPLLERAVNEHAVLVIAYLVAKLFSAISPSAWFVSESIADLVLLTLFGHVVRIVWTELSLSTPPSETNVSPPDVGAMQASPAAVENAPTSGTDDPGSKPVGAQPAVPAPSRGTGTFRVGIPLLSLVILNVLFFLPQFIADTSTYVLMSAFSAGFYLRVALWAPLFWWMTKSSLGIVLVVAEDIGAFAALVRSHKLINGRFWQVFRYLSLVNAVVTLPALIIIFGMDQCLNFIMTRALSWPMFLGAKAIMTLLKEVFWFSSQIIVIGCLVRLYSVLRSTEPKPLPEAQAPNSSVGTDLGQPAPGDQPPAVDGGSSLKE